MRNACLLVFVVCLSSAAAAAAAETVIDVDMKAAAKLPFAGAGARQVSGLKVKLADDGSFTAPDQVCALIFEKGDARAVVRVWEDKANRYFVSAARGDDANDGSEARPFKTIQHAIDHVLKTDKEKKADVYVAGGDYELGNAKLTVSFRVSLYGGFDENGWRRDPVVTWPILLPHGFRENWVDDMPDRFKDLRRAEHRYRETRIWRTFPGKGGLTLDVGTRGSERMETTGTKDTYIDGVTVYGCRTVNRYQPDTMFVSSINDRTIRNCIVVPFWTNGHAYILRSSGRGLLTNNIFWGGIVGHSGHARPQLIHTTGAHMYRNLHVGFTGGDYSRMFLCWGRGGKVEQCQIHGGNSFGWSTLAQGHHGAMRGPEDYVFIGNQVYTDHVGRPFLGAGLVCRDNTFHLRNVGFTTLWTTRNLRITGNTFYCMAKAKKDNVFPTGEKMVRRLGGKFGGKGTDIALVEPAAEAGRTPTIENNRIEEIADLGRRHWNFVDVRKLSRLVKRHGERVTLRPTDPATDLKARAAGAAAVKLTWKASEDPEVVGYVVRWGPGPNSYANHLFVKNVTAAEVKGLKPGKWYFTVSAHKDAYVECWKLSNEATATVGGQVP